MSDANAAREWLRWLYGEQPDGLLWIGGHGDGFGGRTFTDIDAAVAYAMELDAGAAGGVYHRLTTMRPVEHGRGTAADSAYLPAFAMDLDLKGPGHKALNYPETEQELVTLLRKADLPEPTTWVNSGGGRYPFWKLDQPVDLTLPGQLERAADTSRDLHALVIAWAKHVGWKVDNTRDLARVYRLPGTMNRKGSADGAEPVMCTAATPERFVRVFGLREFGSLVRLAENPRPDPEPPAIDPDAGLHAPGTQEYAPQVTGGAQLGGGALFGQTWELDPSAPRSFTLAAAMTFVQPALEALRTAQDGEINNRLNAAAIQLAHFGQEFWSREAAEGQLLAALGQTAYDGATWRAEDTIASAYRAAAALAAAGDAEGWVAVRLPDPPVSVELAPEPAVDEVQALLAEMLTPSQIKASPGKQYLIKNLMHLNSEVWVIGPPGSRKSFVVLDMAGHIATGRPWQGLKVHQGKVVIIAAEGAAGIGNRIRAWEAEHGPMPDDVIILPRPVQARDGAAWRVLVEACRHIGPVLVVADTQARVTVGLEENSATDMGIFVDAVAAIRRATGAAVMPVHHTGRTGGDARGSSALDGAQDTELKVVAAAEPLRGELRVEKQKDMEMRAPLPLAFRVHTVGVDEDGDPVTSLALASADAWEPAREANRLVLAEDWALNWPKTQEQILTVLVDQGGETGITKAEARGHVAERWYGGQVSRDSRREGALRPSTFDTAWSRVLEARAASGDPIVVNSSGQKYVVDPVARLAWNAKNADVTGE